jgi:hypothetical protein
MASRGASITDGSTPTQVVDALLAVVPECFSLSEDFLGIIGELSPQSAVRQREPSFVAGKLADLVSRALVGRPAAIRAAVSVVNGIRHSDEIRHPHAAAAWDIFLASAEARDSSVIDFCLRRQRKAFEAPQLLLDLLEMAPRKRSSLSGADVLACRHLLGSTVAELGTIKALVPDLRFVKVFGKPYSTNRLAVLALEARGFPVDRKSIVLGHRSSLGSFGNRHRRVLEAGVEEWLVEEGTTSDRPVLVIDDGGVLIDIVGRAMSNGRLNRPVIAIEQTTHGMFAARTNFHDEYGKQNVNVRRHGLAVIDAASSRAKLRRESPYIAESVIVETSEWLRLLSVASGDVIGVDPFPNLKVGVIGYGSVGAHVVAQLQGRASQVYVYDRNPHKSAVAEAAGVHTADRLEDLLDVSNLIIAASGAASIDRDAARHLQNGAILVSASSGDLEVRGLQEWKHEPVPLLHRTAEPTTFDVIHGAIHATDPDDSDSRVVRIVNGGFPVNFDGSIDPIEPNIIQVTRAVIVGAVIQAASVGALGDPPLLGSTGVFELEKDLSRFISQQFENLSSRK